MPPHSLCRHRNSCQDQIDFSIVFNFFVKHFIKLMIGQIIWTTDGVFGSKTQKKHMRLFLCLLVLG